MFMRPGAATSPLESLQRLAPAFYRTMPKLFFIPRTLRTSWIDSRRLALSGPIWRHCMIDGAGVER